MAILHIVFTLAVEKEMMVKNPVKSEGRPGEDQKGGGEPFTAEELSKLRKSAGEDLLLFLMLMNVEKMKVLLNQKHEPVNNVSFGSVGMICVTLASQFFRWGLLSSDARRNGAAQAKINHRALAHASKTKLANVKAACAASRACLGFNL